MTMGERSSGVSVLGLGAAACAACCAGPILAWLGGASLLGLASTWVIGGAGVVIAAFAGLAYLGVRRRSTTSSCDAGAVDPVSVALVARPTVVASTPEGP